MIYIESVAASPLTKRFCTTFLLAADLNWAGLEVSTTEFPPLPVDDAVTFWLRLIAVDIVVGKVIEVVAFIEAVAGRVMMTVPLVTVPITLV